MTDIKPDFIINKMYPKAVFVTDLVCALKSARSRLGVPKIGYMAFAVAVVDSILAGKAFIEPMLRDPFYKVTVPLKSGRSVVIDLEDRKNWMQRFRLLDVYKESSSGRVR